MTQQRVSPVVITSLLPATVTQIVRGALGQSVNLQSWQDSNGNVLSSFDQFGRLRVRTTTTSAFSAAITAASAGTVGLMVQGAASQTANLFEAQDSAAAVMASITPNGSATILRNFTVGAATVDTTARTVLSGGAADTIKLIVRGVASQTVNLQEWQDSTNAVLGGMQSNGQLFGLQIKTSNARIFISEANSGGQIIYTRQTAAATNPGANTAAMYFRDGTNAGTLKLVVRAGTAGAETTILDNIPTA